MKKLKLPLYFIVCVALISSCKKEMKSRPAGANLFGSAAHLDRKFIIIVTEGAKIDPVVQNITRLGYKIETAYPELGLVSVRTPDPGFAAKARSIAGVEGVVVDISLKMLPPSRTHKVDSRQLQQQSKSQSKLANNPFSYLQWGLTSIHAPEAWAKGYQGDHSVVAVLDGGFYTHDPELVSNIIQTHSFVDSETVDFKIDGGFSHGTHVAGIIAAADNNQGIVGVAPKAKLILVKVLNDEGRGSFGSVIDGIFYAVNHGADVINMSLGGQLPLKSFVDDNGTPDDPTDDYQVIFDRDLRDLETALNRATTFANTLGVTLIAASGNDGINFDGITNYAEFPASCKNVLAISATGPMGWAYNTDTTLTLPTYYSNFGKSLIKFAAPGGNEANPLDFTDVTVGFVTAPAFVFDWVLSLGIYDAGTNSYGYTWAEGTSMAAPHASGVAALIYGKNYKKHIHASSVASFLRQSATDLGWPGKDDFYGNGQVDAGKAVMY